MLPHLMQWKQARECLGSIMDYRKILTVLITKMELETRAFPLSLRALRSFTHEEREKQVLLNSESLN